MQWSYSNSIRNSPNSNRNLRQIAVSPFRCSNSIEIQHSTASTIGTSPRVQRCHHVRFLFPTINQAMGSLTSLNFYIFLQQRKARLLQFRSSHLCHRSHRLSSICRRLSIINLFSLILTIAIPIMRNSQWCKAYHLCLFQRNLAWLQSQVRAHRHKRYLHLLWFILRTSTLKSWNQRIFIIYFVISGTSTRSYSWRRTRQFWFNMKSQHKRRWLLISWIMCIL